MNLEKLKDIILISRDINDLESLKSDIQIKYNINVDVFELDLSKLDDVKKILFLKTKTY